MALSTVTPSARRAHTGRAAATATARNSIATSERPAQTTAPDLERRRRDLHLVRPTAKRTGLWKGRLVLIGPVLVLVSLLAVAGAQALLTEGQVRLTNLQAEVAAAQTKRFDLELKVAQEEEPAAVVAAAGAQGMIVPPVVKDIPAVNPDPTTAPDRATRTRSTKSKTANGSTKSTNASGHP